MEHLSPGQQIVVSDGRHAVIRFVGSTNFAPGDWVGIELEDASGKNDGSVKGERYFDCEPLYGMFIRPAAVASVLSQPQKDEPKPAAKTGPNGAAARGRPASGVPEGGMGTKRVSMTGVKRQSAQSSPSPAPRAGATGRSLRSPTKSPVKQLSSTSGPAARASATSAGKAPPTGPKPRQSLSNRGSMPPPTSATTASRPARQSLVGSTGRPARPTSQTPRPTLTAPTKRLPVKPSPTKTASSEAVTSGSGEQSEDGIDAESPQKLSPPTSAPAARRPSDSSRLTASQPQRAVSGTSASGKEIEDLKTKLRLMEKKRAEDREKLKSMDTLQAERDKFESIIQKLQAKYQPQQQELTQLKKQLKEVEAKLEEADRLQAEHDSIVEMATLDREMAEEMAEAIKAEFEALKAKAEELEMEVEVLREENQELDQAMSPEEKSSQGWLQMERTNERLREALIRLRDMTKEQETDLRSQIKALEEELEDYAAVKEKYEATKEQLLTTEANMEDLKQQVEALGAEDMIEELAEKNMQYQEQVNELKAVIEDLESLKELNDELELNHIESEKQLQEEIDYRESVHHEQNRRIAQQEEVIEDLEYTLSRFRELVSNLQSDLEDMRVSQQITETEATDLNVRSRAMIDLNMKLQASVAKAQTKTIDVELGRMEAEESAQHLSIMKMYLPEYFDSERNPILALLRFKRVGFKATLMSNTVRERMSDPTAVSSGQDVFNGFDVLDKLTWISCVCDRFINFITGCSSDEFSGFDGALYELEPVERNLNSWIEGLKKNDLNEKKCATELQRSIALLSHLAESLIPPRLETNADELQMRSIMTQTYMDHTASSLTQLRSTLQAKLPPPAEDDEEGPFLFQKIDTISNQARGGKIVVGKVTRSLEELKSRFLTLTDACVPAFETAEHAAKEVAQIARLLGDNIAQLVGEEGRTEPITYAEITANMSQTASPFLESSTAEADTDGLSLLGGKLRALASYLEDVATVSSDLSQTVEFERQESPWVIRSNELKSNKMNSPDADEEIRRLKNEIHEVSTALGVKDKAFEEQTIKIELLESRMRDASKKAALVKELESELETLKAKENELLNVVEKQSGDLQAMEREREDYRARLEKAKRSSASTTGVGADGVISGDAVSSTVMRENEALRAEVASLQAAVRFLRDDNRRANLLDPYSVQRINNMRSWLDTPLTRPKVPADAKRDAYKATSECQDVLTHLMKLTKESKFVDLKATLPADKSNRLAWRPVKSTSRYHILRQREEYEQWAQWKDEVASRERERGRRDTRKRTSGSVHVRGSTHVPVDSAKQVPPVAKSKGMMNSAWRMLGMQRGDDVESEDETAYNPTGDVRVVGQ